jgi:uncharacterized glyoxalase superfamily protein PhnB
MLSRREVRKMAERLVRAEGMPWVTPYLTVRNSAAAMAFYQRAFGFEKRVAMTQPDGTLGHAEVSWREGVIMFGPEGGNGGSCRAPVSLGVVSPVSLYVYCEDVDALFARATEAGAKAELAPQDMFWGDRMCKLVDPDGHVWHFATHVGQPETVEAR